MLAHLQQHTWKKHRDEFLVTFAWYMAQAILENTPVQF
jgi:hypothetical protein